MNINISLPVYNEEAILNISVKKLVTFLKKKVKDNWNIIIVDNGSTDNTLKIAQKLSKNKKIKYLSLKQKGRGRALKQVWQKYPADINIYFDIDLATELSALPNLINSLKEGYDIVMGNRYLKNSDSNRSFFRLFLSQGYNHLVNLFFWTDISDFQCGFKAISKKVIPLLKTVKDNEWFFDTELILRARKANIKIKQLPVRWKEQKETKVKFSNIIFNYIKKIIGLRIQI